MPKHFLEQYTNKLVHGITPIQVDASSSCYDELDRKVVWPFWKGVNLMLIFPFDDNDSADIIFLSSPPFHSQLWLSSEKLHPYAILIIINSLICLTKSPWNSWHTSASKEFYFVVFPSETSPLCNFAEAESEGILLMIWLHNKIFPWIGIVFKIVPHLLDPLPM